MDASSEALLFEAPESTVRRTAHLELSLSHPPAPIRMLSLISTLVDYC